MYNILNNIYTIYDDLRYEIRIKFMKTITEFENKDK